MREETFLKIRESVVEDLEEQFGYFNELGRIKDARSVGEILDHLISMFGCRKAFKYLQSVACVYESQQLGVSIS